MKTLEMLDLTQRHHFDLFKKLIEAYPDTVNPEREDIQSVLTQWHEEIGLGDRVACVMVQDDKAIGLVGGQMESDITIDVFQAMLPDCRNVFTASQFMAMFTELLFETLPIYRIQAEIPTFNRSAEIVARLASFRRDGLKRSSALYKGAVINQVLYSLTREDYSQHWFRTGFAQYKKSLERRNRKLRTGQIINDKPLKEATA